MSRITHSPDMSGPCGAFARRIYSGIANDPKTTALIASRLKSSGSRSGAGIGTGAVIPPGSGAKPSKSSGEIGRFII